MAPVPAWFKVDLQLPPKDQHNTVEHLDRVLNQVQRHRCSAQYCLRKNRTTGHLACRADFPHEIRTEPVLVKPLGATYYRLHPERNEANLNAYNPVINMAWLANIDIAPCTGAEAPANYLSKYVSKFERPSQSYLDMMRAEYVEYVEYLLGGPIPLDDRYDQEVDDNPEELFENSAPDLARSGPARPRGLRAPTPKQFLGGILNLSAVFIGDPGDKLEPSTRIIAL
ncbi:hypothetical protein N7461_000538 [Penicillium sp. DV-2018c]|nr:hypothetical protein N7461_000538 [Penicillium sp. DV-2018c]